MALQTSVDSPNTYKHFVALYRAFILTRCCKHGSFSSDLLYAMRVKMTRRLYKLSDTAPQFLIAAAKAAAEGTRDLLQERWKLVQSTQAQSQSPNLSETDFDVAFNQTLSHSRDFLERVFQGRSSDARPFDFSPDHAPRLENIIEFSQYVDGGLSQAFENDRHLALFDFEASVFDNLASWTSKQSDYSRACAIMFSCFQKCLDVAKPYYAASSADQGSSQLHASTDISNYQNTNFLCAYKLSMISRLKFYQVFSQARPPLPPSNPNHKKFVPGRLFT